MTEKLGMAYAVVETLVRDSLDFLGSNSQVKTKFVKDLSNNFITRVMFWQRGLIPENYTEHGFSEHIIEKGIFLASLPVTIPLCLPALVISSALETISPTLSK